MGTIIRRERKDGSVGYTAQVRVKKGGKVVHAETQTFDREAAAKTWIKKRETELAEPGALDKPEDPILSVVIQKYLGDKLKPHGKTKDQVLRTIANSWLGETHCSQIDSATVIKYLEGPYQSAPNPRQLPFPPFRDFHRGPPCLGVSPRQASL
jgi:hypothetical protein